MARIACPRRMKPLPRRKDTMMMKFKLFFFCLLLLPAPLWASYAPGQKVVSFQAHLDPVNTREGENLRLVVKARIKPGWHIYSVIPQGEDAPPPTKIDYRILPFEFDGPLYETKPVKRFDSAIGLTLAYHEQQAVFYQNFWVPDVDLGPWDLEIIIVYQACDARICLPPVEETLRIPFVMEEGDMREEYKSPQRDIDPLWSKGMGGTEASTIWAFLGLAVMMGLASLVMPCVFPMIPITVTYFSKQAEGSHRRLLKLSALFGLGIMGTYTGLGLVIAGLFGAGTVTRFATNPWVNLSIAGLFILFALSLIGLFRIDIPASWQSYFDQKARKLGGATGVLLMGFTFTLTAFTCTVQFVGTLMIAAAGGEWLWPLVGMLVYSFVFAFPFFLLALAPALVQRMQGKSGEWMGRSKVVLGILELAASLKFISNADLVWQTNRLSRDLNLQIWLALLGVIILYLLWTGLRPKLNRSLWQWTAVGVFTLLLYWTSQGLGNHSLGGVVDSLLPPPSGTARLSGDFASKEEVEALTWYDDLDLALPAAALRDKPIFVEFTGYTCVNCRWMEQNVLAQKQVHEQLANDFVLLRLYTDGGDQAERNQEIQISRYRTVALPLYAIIDPEGRDLRHYIGMSPTLEEFIAFMRGDTTKE